MFERNPRWHELTGATHPRDPRTDADIADAQGICPLKTHESDPRVTGDGTPTIYIIRDGREACVSYWRYYHDILEDRTKALRDIIAGNCMYGSWSDHVKAWKGKAGIAWSFEEMRAALPIVIYSLGCFLRRDIRRQDCESIAERLTSWSDFHGSDPQFFRSGKNATWADVMTADDLALFDELHGDTMREYGYIREPKGVEHAAVAPA